MPSQYIYELHVIAPDGTAQQLWALAYQLCNDVGENNVSTPLVPVGGADDATATHYGFSAPVKQTHIDALFGAGLGVTPGVKWARTDRDGVLQKRWDNETPTPVQYGFSELLAEAGLKLRVVMQEI